MEGRGIAERDYMKKYRIWFIAATMLLFWGVYFYGGRSEAATYTNNEIGTLDKIGVYEDKEGGYSHIGIKLYWDDMLVAYALDTYRKENGNWVYLATNYNGTIYNLTTDYFPSDSLIRVYKTGARFGVPINAFRNGKSEYSVTIEEMQLGKFNYKSLEMANIPAGTFGTIKNVFNYTFLPTKSEQIVCSNVAQSRSYTIRAYSVRNIRPGEEIPADTGGGQITSPGKAYYNGSGYCLTKLPEVTYGKAGYSAVFQGWHSAKAGGKQYQAGDILKNGDTLYARWNVTANEYTVNCVDVLGENANGTVLGRTTWKAKCDEKVSGEKAGTDKTPGAYYPDCHYTGATTATVTASGATVYRYFSYENYPVRFIDQIESGTRKGEMLHSTSEDREFNTTVSGADLGDNQQAGAYYKGYCYSDCTSSKVTAQGTTVYRYFRPACYSIVFDGNGATGGTMEKLEGCLYDDMVDLPRNEYQRVSQVLLYRNQEKLPEETTEMAVTHKFLGWAEEPDGVVKYPDVGSLRNITEQEKEVILYAVWSEEKIVPPSIPSQIGYHFLGWAKEPDAQNAMTQVSVSGSVELYAVWKQEAVKYHVEYYKENLSGEYELASSYEFEGYSGEAVTLDSVDKIYPGFTLDGASSQLSGQIKPDGSLILCAYFKRDAYELSFDLNGGKVPSEGAGFGKEKIRFGKNIFLPTTVPLKEGYIFQGWSLEADNDAVLLSPGDSFVAQNHDTVLYAQWKPLRFTVKYDKNAAYSKVPGISGTVEDTEYVYQKDSYASKTLFKASDAKVVAWNSKPDGSGISVLPGTNMKGLFDSCKTLTLYAIWEHDTKNAASFQLTIWAEAEKDGKVQKEQIDTLLLQGKAGEKISAALLRLYQDVLQGEEAIYFYKGYEVVNVKELEQVISMESDTDVALTVKKRKCSISFQGNLDKPENQIQGVTTEFGEKITLPDKLPDGAKIDRFEDSRGNVYVPGSAITLEHNLVLFVQHAVYLHDETGKEKEQVLYVTRGTDYILPELKKIGYRFLGWYSADGKKAGDAGDTIKNILKRCDYYAKWSEPLTYHISYDMEGFDIKILENNISYYQYSKETILPNASQVSVPEGYQFAGWYYSDDIDKKPVAVISASEHGDKILKPLLIKKAGNDEDKDKDDKNPVQDGDGNTPPDTDKNPGSSDANQEDNPGDSIINKDKDSLHNKQQTQKKGKLVKGSTFWKGNLKYKVISTAKGKESVKVVGSRQKGKKLSVPAKVPYGKQVFAVIGIGEKAFYKASKLTTVILSKNIKKIGVKAFAQMKNLKSITIGKGIEEIAKSAFQKDKKLKKVVIKGKKLAKIGKKAFAQIHPKATIKVVKSNKKTSKKFLKASGLKKTIRIC